MQLLTAPPNWGWGVGGGRGNEGPEESHFTRGTFLLTELDSKFRAKEIHVSVFADHCSLLLLGGAGKGQEAERPDIFSIY